MLGNSCYKKDVCTDSEMSYSISLDDLQFLTNSLYYLILNSNKNQLKEKNLISNR
jgi:hypothetical protein